MNSKVVDKPPLSFEPRRNPRREKKGKRERKKEEGRGAFPANCYQKAEASLRIMSGRCCDRVAAWEQGTNASSFSLRFLFRLGRTISRNYEKYMERCHVDKEE